MKKRILSLLLCCCLLAGAFRPTQAHAIAGVDDAALLAAGGVALVGSLLVAGGAAFKSNDDLQAVAQDIYDRYIQPSSALLSEVTGLVKAWYKGVGSGVVCCANISTRLWNSVCGEPVKENVASGNYGGGAKKFNMASGRSAWNACVTYCNSYEPKFCSVDGVAYSIVNGDDTDSYFDLYSNGSLVKEDIYITGGGPMFFRPYYFQGVFVDSCMSVTGGRSGFYKGPAITAQSVITVGQGLAFPTDKDLNSPRREVRCCAAAQRLAPVW